MGEIYLATDEKLQRSVAIKMMLSPEDESDNKRFQLESQTVAGFKDPHTIRLFDYGLTRDGFQYQVIEYLEGSNIKQFLQSQGALHPAVAKSIGIQLCGSLAEAHRKNILHRDIKPSNIMLIHSPERGLQSKLLDFGLVRADNHDPTMTQTGTVLGSPMYMSPEQIDEKSSNLTAQSDIYSLGLTMYTMVTGQTPFKGGSISSVLAAQLFQQPKDPTITQPILIQEPTLCWIINTAIQKETINRFSSIFQMQKAIELSIHDSLCTLRLEDGNLFCNDEVVTEMSSMSLQSLSIHTATSIEPVVDTLRIQQEPPEKSIETNRSSILLTLGIVFTVVIGGLLWPKAADSPTPRPTVIESSPNDLPSTIVQTQTSVVKTASTDADYATLNIVSNPSNADIHHEEMFLGTTPGVIKIPKDEQWTLTIKKFGFKTTTKIVDSTSESWTVKLINKTVPTKNSTAKEPVETLKDTPPSVKQVTNPFEKP